MQRRYSNYRHHYEYMQCNIILEHVTDSLLTTIYIPIGRQIYGTKMVRWKIKFP